MKTRYLQIAKSVKLPRELVKTVKTLMKWCPEHYTVTGLRVYHNTNGTWLCATNKLDASTREDQPIYTFR